MRWLRLSKRGWWRLKRKNGQRRRAGHIKERSEIKWWKERNEGSTGVLPQDHFKKMTAEQIPLSPLYHLQCLIFLFNLSSSAFSRWIGLSFSHPLLFSQQINDAEDDVEARHRYLSLCLRFSKIRNSPLIWNKWPSSGKPKPPDSSAWFIKGAWSRKLVRPRQKLKLCPHVLPNWRWGLKSTIFSWLLAKNK